MSVVAVVLGGLGDGSGNGADDMGEGNGTGGIFVVGGNTWEGGKAQGSGANVSIRLRL